MQKKQRKTEKANATKLVSHRWLIRDLNIENTTTDSSLFTHRKITVE